MIYFFKINMLCVFGQIYWIYIWKSSFNLIMTTGNLVLLLRSNPHHAHLIKTEGFWVAWKITRCGPFVGLLSFPATSGLMFFTLTVLISFGAAQVKSSFCYPVCIIFGVWNCGWNEFILPSAFCLEDSCYPSSDEC